MTYKELYDKAKANILVIVDVRTKEEYDEGHIPGARHCDLQHLLKDAPHILKSKDETYYVYCQTGFRSQMAVMQLNMMDYKDVHDMGGIVDWPYDIEI